LSHFLIYLFSFLVSYGRNALRFFCKNISLLKTIILSHGFSWSKSLKRIIFFCAFLFMSTAFAAESTDNSVVFFADLLLWKVREGSADNWAQVITPAGTDREATLEEVPFQTSPGYRLGFEYHPKQSQWDTNFYFTTYHTSAHDSASGDVYSAYLGNFYAFNTLGNDFGPYYGYGDVDWKVRYDTLDLELGRTFKIDDILTLHPYLGLKAAVINQNIDTYWSQPRTTSLFTAATENLKNDFWGIGPSIGLKMTLPVFHSKDNQVNLFSNFSGALLWGNWHFKDNYHNDFEFPVTISIKTSDITGAAPMGRGVLGVEWDTHLSTVDTTVRLGYEAQVWLNQLQYYSYNMGRLNNLMSLQGAVLDFSFSFS
jgi:hypothetical protein